MAEKTGLFICGVPRSGTTLLRSILSSHSQIVVTPESHFFSRWVSYYGKDKEFDRKELGAFLEQLYRWDRFKNYNISPDEFTAHLNADGGAITLAEVFNAMMICYAKKENKPIWCEKTPYNEMFLREIWSWYPNAFLIYIIRDPRAVISSLLETPWATNNLYTNLVQWKRSVRIYIKNKEKFAFLRYEDLVDRPDETICDLCEDMGVDFEREMLQQRGASIKEDRSGWAKGALAKAAGEIDPKIKEKWRQHLSLSQVWVIEQFLKKEMGRFGYQKSRAMVSCDALRELLVNLILHYKSSLPISLKNKCRKVIRVLWAQLGR